MRSVSSQSTQSWQLRRHTPVMPSIFPGSLSHLPAATSDLHNNTTHKQWLSKGHVLCACLAASKLQRVSRAGAPPLADSHRLTPRHHSHSLAVVCRVHTLCCHLEGVKAMPVRPVVDPLGRGPLGALQQQHAGRQHGCCVTPAVMNHRTVLAVCVSGTEGGGMHMRRTLMVGQLACREALSTSVPLGCMSQNSSASPCRG